MLRLIYFLNYPFKGFGIACKPFLHIQAADDWRLTFGGQLFVTHAILGFFFNFKLNSLAGQGGIPFELLARYWWPTVGHQLVQCCLCLFGIFYIADFYHLTFIAHHVSDLHRVMSAILGAVLVNTATILDRTRCGTPRQHLQPGAASQLLAAIRVHPDFSIGHKFCYRRVKRFPAFNFLSRHG